MRSARRVVTTFFVVLVAGRLPEPAAAQPTGTAGLPRAEIRGGLAVAMPISDGTMNISYEPPCAWRHAARTPRQPGPECRGRRGCVPRPRPSTCFLPACWVCRVHSRPHRPTLAIQRQLDTFLRYISLPPPDYSPGRNTYEQSRPWAPTTWHAPARSLAVGGVVRWRAAAGRVVARWPGASTSTGSRRELDSVGCTQFVLGGTRRSSP